MRFTGPAVVRLSSTGSALSSSVLGSWQSGDVAWSAPGALSVARASTAKHPCGAATTGNGLVLSGEVSPLLTKKVQDLTVEPAMPVEATVHQFFYDFAIFSMGEIVDVNVDSVTIEAGAIDAKARVFFSFFGSDASPGPKVDLECVAVASQFSSWSRLHSCEPTSANTSVCLSCAQTLAANHCGMQL